MNPTLRIAAVPLDIAWADPARNLQRMRNAVDDLPAGTDLVVFPELFTTGFINDGALLQTLAEPNSGPTMQAVAALARERNIAIAGSFLARTGQHYYNRGFIVEPSGDETFYDKRHLFCISSEAAVYRPGTDAMPIVRFRGWNLSMIVCYDLRFPAWCRNRNNAYDILLVPANWARARSYAWEHLLIARAIENQAIVVGANRSGNDDYGNYDGLTYIYDVNGMPAGRPAAPGSKIVVADVSHDSIATARRRLPVCQDADCFNII